MDYVFLFSVIVLNLVVNAVLSELRWVRDFIWSDGYTFERASLGRRERQSALYVSLPSARTTVITIYGLAPHSNGAFLAACGWHKLVPAVFSVRGFQSLLLTSCKR